MENQPQRVTVKTTETPTLLRNNTTSRDSWILYIVETGDGDLGHRRGPRSLLLFWAV